VDERSEQPRRLIWLLVAGLFAGIFYSIGFNVGCEEGEGRVWRRHMQRIRDAQVQHVADTPAEFSAVRPAEDAAEPPSDAEQIGAAAAFADALGRSIQPSLASPSSPADAF
jgi:hypothetical protein